MLNNNSKPNLYDVVILGGGPAGTATALALKRLDSTLRIALVEKAGYSTMRIGETLPPLAQMLLRELGVWEAFLATSPLASHGTRAAWGSSDFHENEFIFSPYGHGWHVDRTAFDAMLAAEAARAGIEVILPAAPYTSSRDGKHWTLAIKSRESGCRKLSSRFVVDATGPKAWFASRQGARHLVHDRLAGAFVIFQCDSMDTYTSVEACEHGWWYSAVLPAQRMIAAFMADAADFRHMPWRQLDEWKALAALAPHTAARIAKANALGGPMLRCAVSRRLDRAVGDHWLAAGDAASTFDPLSSQGIMKAMRCGIRAAHTVLRYLRGHGTALAQYAELVERECDRYLDARAAYYRLEQRWPDSSFWQQRQEKVTFQPLQRVSVSEEHSGYVA